MKDNNQFSKYYTQEQHVCSFFLEKTRRDRPTTSNIQYGFISPRLAYILRGECTVKFSNGQTLECKEGSVWFIPKNEPYTSIWRSNDYIEFYAIEFDVDYLSNAYTTFQSLDNTDTLCLFRELFNNKERNDPIKTTLSFYKILDKILPLLKKDNEEDLLQILPALNYLNTNFTAKVKVVDLAKMCYTSESRFYQLFKKLTKLSPIEYKNQIKLSHAVKMIKNKNTLEEICERLNFTSPSFLRRLIKAHFNKSPKEIKKEQLLI